MIDENAGVEDEVLGAGDETGVEEDESLSSGDSQDSTDWEAVAKQERERAENYKTALTQKRQLRRQGPAEEVVDTDGEDDKPLTRAEFNRALQETVAPMIAGNRVDAILSERIKDSAKRTAVKLIYENRVRQTGTSDEAIRQDIDAAVAIAESNKVRKMASEMERVNGQERSPSLSGPGADRGVDRRKHGFTDVQVAELTKSAQRLNIDPEKFILETWKNTKKG